MTRLPLKQRIPLVLAELESLYPDAHCELNFRNPFELLIATILSAQCTDVRVNLVTPALFLRFPDAPSVLTAKPDEIEELIRTAGFYRAKAKSIRGAAKRIVEQHGGEVPATLEELVQLPGVGRKTANVVLGDAFDIPGITVDTHVGRLSRRLGFTRHTDPVKVEFALHKLIPQAEWTRVSHRLIFHGRRVCLARKPACSSCTLFDLCPKVGVSSSKSQVSKPRFASFDPVDSQNRKNSET